MGAHLIRVGVREFRGDLARFLDSTIPVAVTRHGQTVGYFVPAHGKVNDQELIALKSAVERLEALLNQHGISADEVVSDFRARRQG